DAGTTRLRFSFTVAGVPLTGLSAILRRRCGVGSGRPGRRSALDAWHTRRGRVRADLRYQTSRSQALLERAYALSRSGPRAVTSTTPLLRCGRRGPIPVEQHGSGTGGELSQELERLLSCIVPGMRRQLGWLCVLPVVAALTPSQTASANAPSFASAMEAASQARHVPLPLI